MGHAISEATSEAGSSPARSTKGAFQRPYHGEMASHVRCAWQRGGLSFYKKGRKMIEEYFPVFVVAAALWALFGE